MRRFSLYSRRFVTRGSADESHVSARTASGGVGVHRIHPPHSVVTRPAFAALTAVLALGTLSACVAQDNAAATQVPAASTSRETFDSAVSAEAKSTPPAEANNTDLHFLGMMTPHHAQAVEMSDIVLEADGISEQTRDLALRIKEGQQKEIDIMEKLASDWGQQDMMEFHSSHVANGMLMPDQMAELSRLSGREADTLFLQLMHFHHEGALAMTEDEVENGGYGPLKALAQEMIDVQTAEMKEMEAQLSARGASVVPES